MRYKNVFISDIHLGSISCKHRQLLGFLKTLDEHQPDNLYLVGDIIDLWKLNKGFSWKPEHNVIVQKILRLSRKGVKVHYILGNHDESFRSLPEGFRFGDIEVSDQCEFVSTYGKKYLVIHGDQYDTFLLQNGLLARIGSFAYDSLVVLNSALSFVRRKLGLPYWSLSHYVKVTAKNATAIVDIFENSMSENIKEKGYDGVICGHIHLAKIKLMDGFKYINCGDWTESCSAVVEYETGEMGLVFYKEEHERDRI